MMMTYVNAGHEPGYVLRKNELIKIDGPGFPLGLSVESSYVSANLALQPDDRIVLFTDGFTDILNKKGERFDSEVLLEMMQILEKRNTQTFVETLVKSLMEYKENAEQADDMAIISVKVMS
jgi:sigma-B regulation protein RsbU (phosphoserine phosphatase)